MILIAVLLLVAAVARIPEAQRKFSDPCLEQAIQSYRSKLSARNFRIFQNSFPNTLDTTISHHDPAEPLTYVITGDIPAMWLRDSTNQILPYLRLDKTCPKIKTLVQGVINMQAKFIMVDPYTNAFVDYYEQKNRPFYLNDHTFNTFFGSVDVDLTNGLNFSTSKIWERKYEIDSLSSFLRLIYEYHNKYTDSNYDWINMNVVKALKNILRVLDEQTHDELNEKSSGHPYYVFRRSPVELKDGVIPVGSRNGMIRSGFRPSDDPNEYPYNVPGNAMASTYLKKVAEILFKLPFNSFYQIITDNIARRMVEYSSSIRQGIQKFGIVTVNGTKMYAYEVDGKGNHKLYDDANLPSLISLPYLEFVSTSDPIYVATRQYMLSTKNVFYYQHGQIKGIGSPHTPGAQIWPLAVMTQALTSTSKDEVKQCIKILQDTTFDDFLHESVSVTNPQAYTRSWFAWANSFFGELMIDVVKRFPDVALA